MPVNFTQEKKHTLFLYFLTSWIWWITYNKNCNQKDYEYPKLKKSAKSVNLTVMRLINLSLRYRDFYDEHIYITWSSLLAQCPPNTCVSDLIFLPGMYFYSSLSLFFLLKMDLLDFGEPSSPTAISTSLNKTWVVFVKLLMPYYIIMLTLKYIYFCIHFPYWMFLQLCGVHSILQ